MTPTPVGRFAPSPTGPLHVGSLLAALASWLDARAAGGRWHLRIEDLDTPRCSREAADSILHTLAAFGLEHDGEVIWQSQRSEAYAAALQTLGDAVYPCACSRREVADSALAGIDGPVYPGTCRNGLAGRTARAWRVRVDDTPVCFDDRLQGRICQRLQSEVGDFVVRRADGLYAYQLAVVVDDAALGVSSVVRGADLLDSTPRQIHLQRLLGIATPSYLHLPVLTNPAHEKLSKQTLAPAVAAEQAPTLLDTLLALLGQAPVARGPQSRRLEQAVTQWQTLALPRRRAMVYVDALGQNDGHCAV